ncbi:hypothetical protein H5P28_10630 [Ruficoccus amylovorans]|uniref:Uncharacterized protein n=2 Tax=Ruficoccus amylovorans TaxID=1804625 RepID=A0A842HDT7_9BACT|nr:hypothetical protein [Ruficoccus amylovorans]
MSWRTLAPHRDDPGAAFYPLALAYAQTLWQRGLSARSLLALDRAFFARLDGSEPVLKDWPLPYRALVWIIRHNPGGTFIGNPRVHFQHLADRVRGKRREQKSARAWACWTLVRAVRPELPGDPRHAVDEPDEASAFELLREHGHPGEADYWRNCLHENR